MIKTNINNIAKPNLPLIVYGVLKGYIKRPLPFMVKTIITFRSFKKCITLDLPNDFINSTAFMAWLYLCLKKYISNEQAFEVTRAAILVSGLAVQQGNFRNVEEIRTYQNLIKYQQKANKEGSTSLNIMKIIEQSNKKYEFHITKCLFFEVFNYLEVPELTPIMCSIDNAIFNTYLPEKITFHRNGNRNTMPDGAKECVFVIENSSCDYGSSDH